MLEYFDILQDKFDSPYFELEEKLTFLNRAQVNVVNQMVPPSPKNSNVEINNDWKNSISSIISTIKLQAIEGVLYEEAIVDEVERQILKVLNITVAKSHNLMEGAVVVEVPFNEWSIGQLNSFIRDSRELLTCFRDADGYHIKNGHDSWFYLAVVKRPLDMTEEQDCELADALHNVIITEALMLAGIGSRDKLLTELSKVQSL